jgi:ribosomal protein S18 acetylase RimI-like enzyme
MVAQTSIRLAASADLPELHPVIERAYRGESARDGWTHEADLIDGARTSLQTLHGIIIDDHSALLVARATDAIVGCVALWNHANGLAHLGQLCVEPTLQDRGIGRQLVAAAEAFAVEAFGADRVEMTVIDSRDTLIAWYGRRGYRPTGERRDFPVALDPPLHMTVLLKNLRAR